MLALKTLANNSIESLTSRYACYKVIALLLRLKRGTKSFGFHLQLSQYSDLGPDLDSSTFAP